MAKRDEFRLDITANDQASGKIDEVAGKLEGLNAKATVSIDAEDNATETIEDVTQEVETLDGETAEPTLSADDEATDVVEGVTEAVETLDDETAETTLTADDEASGVIETVVEELGGITDASATITVDDTGAAGVGDIAADLGSIEGDFAATVTVDDADAAGVGTIIGDLEDIGGVTFAGVVDVDDTGADGIDVLATDLESIDGTTYEGAVDVDDSGADSVDTLATDLEGIDDATFSGAVEVDDSGADGVAGIADDVALIAAGATASLAIDGEDEAKSATGTIATNLGLGAAAAAGIVTSLLNVGSSATDQILEVDSLATAIGTSLEQASAVKEAWELAGGNVDTLERTLIRVNDKLRASPELAAQLGLTITENMTPLDVFVEAVDTLNSGQLTVNERLALATDIFGTKGVLMLDDIQSRVGDLSDAMDDVSEDEIITQADVDAALEFQQSWDDVADKMSSIQRSMLPGINLALTGLSGIMDGSILPAIENFANWVTPPWLDFLMGGNGQSTLDELMGEEDPEVNPVFHLPPEFETWTEYFDSLPENTFEASVDVEGMDQLAELEERQRAAAEAAAAHQAAIDEEISSLENQKDALDDATDALDDKIDAERRSVDAFYAEESAAKKAQKAEDDYYATNEDGTFVIEDREEAVMNVVEANDRYAQSVVELARQDAAANGVTLSRTAAIDLENVALMGQATRLSGPLRDAVLAHVLRINGIPETRITHILADDDPNNLAQVQHEIDTVSKTRHAAVIADANDAAVAAVEKQLNNLARTRYQTVVVTTVGHESTGRIGGYATGTPYAAQGLRWVGEQGPELVDFNGGERVVNDRQSDEMADSWRGGGNTYITTLNVPSGTTARDALKATRRYGRTQAA